MALTGHVSVRCLLWLLQPLLSGSTKHDPMESLMTEPRVAVRPGRHQHALFLRLFACLLLLTAFAMAPFAQAATASPGGEADQPIVHRLLDAMGQGNYQAFVGQGTPEFAALGEAQFTQVANAIGPRLQKGYTVEHLGNLRQQGLDISVWKVSFKDQGDDLLATLNVRDGRVGGFFLR